MHKFTIAAATIAFGASLALAPAQAEMNSGGPTKNGNQCFKYSTGHEKDGRFGFWAACPQAANIAAAPQQLRKRSSASR